jgi:hypothetical protein
MDELIIKLQKAWTDIEPRIVEEAVTKLKNEVNAIDFTQEKIPETPNTYGIYLFQICLNHGTDISEFKNDFEQNWKIDKSPQIIVSRFKITETGTWYPLYIGKAEKLSNRIYEHCFQDKNKPTYGLKLKHRTELLDKVKIRYSYYKVADKENPNKKAIQFVMTNLESAIRDKLNPWIGKQ